MSSLLIVPVAIDFTCSQSWIGIHQALRLRDEFGLKIEWRPYLLHPEGMPFPEIRPSQDIPGKASIPSRFELQLMLEGMDLPSAQQTRPKQIRVHTAAEALAYYKLNHPETVDEFVLRVASAYWTRGERIDELEVILKLAEEADTNLLRNALEARKFASEVVHFDAPAYKTGVFNLPTFWIGDEKFAEQPYSVLRQAVAKLRGEGAGSIYAGITFPSAPPDRPYVFIDMVTTIDGKILSGEREEHVVDLGSKTDHALMKRLEAAADCVLVGGQTLRSAKPSWNPRAPMRVVVSSSGDLPWDSCFFSENAFVATGKDANMNLPEGVGRLEAGTDTVDLGRLLRSLRDRGVKRLLVLGGSNLNAQIIRAGLADELFLTIAPKVKLGKDVPTYADGEPLSRNEIQNFELVEHHRVEHEMFLRYRRRS